MKEKYVNYITLVCFLWILFFTFNPEIVKVKREWEFYPSKMAQPDPLKCLIFSVFISLFLLIIIKIVNYYFVSSTRSSFVLE